MKRIVCIVPALALALIIATALYAQNQVVVDNTREKTAQVTVDVSQFNAPTSKKTEAETAYGQFDAVKYTLGPNDVVEINVLRHPEFSGRFGVNQEGKIQYKFVGDVEVKGMTKAQLTDKLKEALVQYVVSPEIDISIIEYGSKVFYIMGEVAAPGQYIMKAETITLRDAIHLAGLPTPNASMRRCQLITPSDKGAPKVKNVDLYALLYCGDLRKNVMISPGDILYVPATVMAKVIRTISPVTTVIGLSASAPEAAGAARTGVEQVKKGRTVF
jgi:polysaccharide export outer membrane protein